MRLPVLSGTQALAAFRKVGYELAGAFREKPGHKATYELELAITRAQFCDARARCVWG